MGRHALIVEYDGRPFYGFQIQAKGPTIQKHLEETLSAILREPIRVLCAGRTDSGVHATGQVVSFSSIKEKDDIDYDRLIHSANGMLPTEISIRHGGAVPPDFHARYTCVAREYEYLIWNSKRCSPLWNNRALWHPTKLPVEDLNEELQSLTGIHDFSAYTPSVYAEKTTIRRMHSLELLRAPDPFGDSDDLVIFRIRANAFLHNMIRILVGSFLNRSQGKLKKSLMEILRSKDRTLAGETAPPHGLYFRHAFYPPQKDTRHLRTLEEQE